MVVLWLFCVLLCVVCVLFSFKIILMGKREFSGFTLFIFLVACDYFILSWVGLHCVILEYPDDTHLLFFEGSEE